jgi:hypothetical protein
MKNNEFTPEKKSSAQTAETTEPTNRKLQFDRLLKASGTAREIRSRMIDEAPTQKAALYLAGLPVNHYLLNFVYKTEGITDFKKFGEWKQTGAVVKKGSKAFPIWGQPIGAQKEEEAQSKGENYIATEEENKRYPICYVFSNLQVHPIEERGATC